MKFLTWIAEMFGWCQHGYSWLERDPLTKQLRYVCQCGHVEPVLQKHAEPTRGATS